MPSLIAVSRAHAGTTVLGVPVGTPEFSQQEVTEQLADLEGMLQRLHLLESTLARFLILRA